jgi:hypothetical protein
MSATPESALSRAQHRILLHRTLDVFFRFGLAYWTVVVLVCAAVRLWTGDLPAPVFAWGALALFVLGWIAWTVAVFPGRTEVARRLDHAAVFQDRFVTYLEFKSIGARTPWHELALEQNAAEIVRMDVAKCCPIRIPRQTAWLILPLICFLTLWIFDAISRPVLIRDAELEKVLVAKSEELKKLSEQIRKQAEAKKIDELRKMAEEMKQSAEMIKPAEGKDAEEMKKNALLEWSRLESKLGEMAKAPSGASAAELKQLAETLEQDPATADLSRMLKQDDLAGAMQALQQMMEQAQHDPAAAQELREMAQRMGQAQMSSEQMAEMMKQMRQAAAGGQSPQLQKAAQDFSKMLSNMEKSKQQSQVASSSLSAMQMMRSGMTGGSKAQQGMGKGTKGEQLGMGEGQGQSEQKEGLGIGSETVENIFGDRSKIDAQRNAVKIEGQTGEGQSFENVLRGTAEASTSTVEYRELFNNYTPEAEEAIFKENIPLGSKYYIKRYFEAIRPQQ